MRQVFCEIFNLWSLDRVEAQKAHVAREASDKFKRYGYSDSTVNELMATLDTLCHKGFEPDRALSFLDRILRLKVEEVVFNAAKESKLPEN